MFYQLCAKLISHGRFWNKLSALYLMETHWKYQRRNIQTEGRSSNSLPLKYSFSLLYVKDPRMYFIGSEGNVPLCYCKWCYGNFLYVHICCILIKCVYFPRKFIYHAKLAAASKWNSCAMDCCGIKIITKIFWPYHCNS